jgi:hypothetical protein
MMSMMKKSKKPRSIALIITSFFLGSGHAGYAMNYDDELLSLQSMSASQTPLDTIELEGSVEIPNLRASIIDEVKDQMRQYPVNLAMRAWIEDMRRFYDITDEELQVNHGE